MVMTYGNFIVGLRRYIEEQTGVTTVWRYPGYTAPAEPQFVALEFINRTVYNETKFKDLVNESIYLNCAIYTDNVVQHADLQGKITQILLYHTIPLRDYSGNQVGEFSVSRINSDINQPFGTHVEDETNDIRSYIDFTVELAHVKIREN